MRNRSTLEEVKRQMPAARAAARRAQRQPWWPIAASYDRAADQVVIGLRSGAVVAVPRSALKELKRATNAQLDRVELVGDGLRWDDLDVDVSVPGLLTEVLGPSFVAQAAGRIGGSARTEAKAAAARANGAKGGRPRKKRVIAS